MKLLLLTTFAAMLCYVNAGKTQRLLAAMMANAAAGNAAGVNPALIAAGLNPPLVVGGGAGLIGQPQFPQFVPLVPGGFAVQAPPPNMYAVPPANVYQPPFMGMPQMAPMPQMNPPQQPVMGGAGGAMPQQLPAQPGPLPRFRRQLVKQENALKGTVDTQIPTPTDTTTPTLCDQHNHHEDN